MNESTRAYIYRIAVALSVLAVGFSIISEEQAALILPVVAAVLGNGLAALNTSTSSTNA